MKHSPDMAIIHYGTNNLRSKLSYHEIETNIIKLGSSMKSADNKVFFVLAFELNKYLSKMVGEHELGFIDNTLLVESFVGTNFCGYKLFRTCKVKIVFCRD